MSFSQPNGCDISVSITVNRRNPVPQASAIHVLEFRPRRSFAPGIRVGKKNDRFCNIILPDSHSLFIPEKRSAAWAWPPRQIPPEPTGPTPNQIGRVARLADWIAMSAWAERVLLQ